MGGICVCVCVWERERDSCVFLSILHAYVIFPDVFKCSPCICVFIMYMVLVIVVYACPKFHVCLEHADKPLSFLFLPLVRNILPVRPVYCDVCIRC
jgi:hypothetical protein